MIDILHSKLQQFYSFWWELSFLWHFYIRLSVVMVICFWNQFQHSERRWRYVQNNILHKISAIITNLLSTDYHHIIYIGIGKNHISAECRFKDPRFSQICLQNLRAKSEFEWKPTDFVEFCPFTRTCGQVLDILFYWDLLLRHIDSHCTKLTDQHQRIYSTYCDSWPLIGLCMAVSVEFALWSLFRSKRSVLLWLFWLYIHNSSGACHFDDYHSKQKTPFDQPNDRCSPSPESSHGHHIESTQYHTSAQWIDWVNILFYFYFPHIDEIIQ